jgi:hypothetical protein
MACTLKILLAAFLAASLVHTSAYAVCKRGIGFAVMECADRAYVAPVPEGGGAVSALFWQIGFGNALINNGEGSTGTGVFPLGVFSGNDSGLFSMALTDAREHLRDDRVPPGALCIDPANWGNTGVDGCCDDARDPNQRGAEDSMLNPTFDTRVQIKEGRFVPTLDRVQDYPMAILLKEDTGAWFAVAAVASRDRGDVLEDLRSGNYTFGAVQDGAANPLTGLRNVIPWQGTPVPTVKVLGPAPGADSASEGPRWRASVRWEGVSFPSDLSHRPSEAYEIDNPGHGAGVADMGRLVTYVVEAVHLTSIMIDENGYPLRDLLVWEPVKETSESEAILDFQEDTCLRIAVHFGKRSRTRSVSVNECALGRCGDIGYKVAGPSVCLEGDLLRKVPAGSRAVG